MIQLSARLRRCGFSDYALRLSMSRNDIGNYLGLAIETVSRVLSRFAEKGLIQVENKDIHILQRDALCLVAGH